VAQLYTQALGSSSTLKVERDPIKMFVSIYKTTQCHNSEDHNLHISLYNYEVFTAVTVKNAVLWDEVPCASCEETSSSETSLLTKLSRLPISEDGILYITLFE
jgi:hypothetical protein